MKVLGTLCLLLGSCVSVLAGTAAKSDAEWLKLKQAQLAGVKGVTNLANVGLWTSGDKGANGLYTYFPRGNGLIVFEDKTWVLIVSHSIHAEDGLDDLTLIRTCEGEYYVNRGHVCAQLILESKEKIASLNIFLKAKGKGPKAEPISWEPYKGEPLVRSAGKPAPQP